MKPLTTLGDALAAKGADWRAQLRAEDVPRRPPPSSRGERPDRGYVEQPEERVNATAFPPRQPPHQPPRQQRRRVETPTLYTPVALIRFEHPAPEPMPPEPMPPEPIYYVPPPAELMPPEPLTQPPPPTTVRPEPEPEESEVVSKKRKKRTVHSYEDKVRYTRRLLDGESYASVAKDAGVSPSAVPRWVEQFGAAARKLRRAADKTLASTPQSAPRSAAPSAPVSSAGDPPPPELIVRFEGLEAYIQAIAAKAVRAELKRRLGDD